MKLNYFIKLSLSLLLILLLSFTMIGCESTEQNGIPEELAFILVGNCDYYDSNYIMTREIRHNYSSESHLDQVTLIWYASSTYGYYYSYCNATFQYDRTSDNWYLLQTMDWSSPEYVFGSNLIGIWNVKNTFNSNNNSSYQISINKIDNNQISLSYKINEYFYGDLFTGTVCLELDGSSTIYVDSSKYLYIPIQLPANYRANHGGGRITDETDFVIILDISKGIRSAYFSDTLVYLS